MLKTQPPVQTSPGALFLTYGYNDVFNAATALAKAINPARLHDPGKPVTISVRGDYNSGKKIFSDAAARFFFGNWGKEGGISYIHNYDGFARTADIDIVIRQAIPKEAENLQPGLTDVFKRFARSQALSRFISLNVNDETLLSHPRFAKFVDRMNAQTQDTMCMYGKSQPLPQNI